MYENEIDKEISDEPISEISEDNYSLSELSSEDEMVEIVGIRFKEAGKIYYFSPGEIKLDKGSYAIVETARGIEFGFVIISNKMVPVSETVQPLRQVIRMATEEDIIHHDENTAREKEAFEVCCEKIQAHNLEMKLIDVEYTFDNTKLMFYFTADGRVDFRDLVKDLASVFRTRIELRQIGIRDEAKLLGGLGVCGRPFCCKTFLSDFVQVSIKMAKEQNLSLNSAKISGACGRLMCCLRYEYDTYEEELKKIPPIESKVQTPEGVGTITEIYPLMGTVKVLLNDVKSGPYQKIFSSELIKVISLAQPPKDSDDNADSDVDFDED